MFVGYPIWYGSMATPMQAFLHEHASKLAGKRIALFATSGGSGISASIGEARSLCPESDLRRSNGSDLLDTFQMGAALRNGSTKSAPAVKNPVTPGISSPNVNISVGDRTITATMEDNAAARDFLSRLPLEVTLNDYNHTTEKNFSYPRSG